MLARFIYTCFICICIGDICTFPYFIGNTVSKKSISIDLLNINYYTNHTRLEERE